QALDGAPIREAWRAVRGRVQPSVSSVSAAVSGAPEPLLSVGTRRASIAVMPFGDGTSGCGEIAEALAHDVITGLAQLRSLFVFALQERRIAPEEAGRLLNVDYVASGSVRRQRDRLLVMVEVVDTSSARIVWTETYDRQLGDVWLVQGEIGNKIVASIASEIET